ncbi:MAG: hypothetical protein ACTHWH_07810 [Marinobacter sp.]
MTELFAQKQLVDLPYALEDVKAAALSTVQLSEGSDSCSGDNWRAFQQPTFASEDKCRAYFAKIDANKLTDWLD